jgi:hypothetical protein
MPREAQLATGEILEFPDETPDAVMDAAVKRHIAGAAPPSRTYAESADSMGLQPDVRKILDASWAAAQPGQHAAVVPKPPPDRVGENLTGANRGIFSMLGAPVDVISSTLRSVGTAATDPNTRAVARGNPLGAILEALNATGVGERLRDAPAPVGGSQSIEAGAQAVGVPIVEPVDRQGRITSRVLQEIMGTLIPTAGAVRAGAKAKASGRQVKADEFVAPFANSPVRETVNQAALGGAAGTGAALATEAIDGPVSDIVGALFGSAVGSNAARMSSLAGRTVKDIVDPKRIAREEVGTRIVKSMTDKDVDMETGKVRSAGSEAFGKRLDEARGLERDVPGLKLTTGEATTDPGLQGLEFQRRGGGPGSPNSGVYRQRETTNRAAINTALDAEAPAAPTDAAARRALEARRSEATAPGSKVAGAVEGGERAVDTARARAQPEMGVQEAGREIRDTAQRGKDTMESVRDAEALPLLRAAGERGAVIDATPVAKVIDDKLAVDKRDSVRSALATARSKLLKVGSKDELDTSVAGLYEARKAINDIIEGRGEKPTDRFAKSELLEVRKALDDAINKGAPEFGQYLSKYAEDSRLVDPYKTGATKDVIKSTSDRDAAARFWESPDSIQEFEANLGGNKNARKALRAYALEDALNNASDANGAVSPKKLEAWVAKNRAQLDAFPDIRDDLGSLAAAQKSLERAGKRKSMVEKGLNDPKKSTIAKYLDREDSRDSIDAILRSKNPRREMTQLVNTLKRDPDALEGAKRAFWDRMMEGTPSSPRSGIKATEADAADTPVIKNAAMKEFLAKHGDAARILYADNPQHLDRLTRISEAVSAAQRTTKIKAPGTSGTPQGMAGMTLAGVLSRVYAVRRGVVGLPYVITEAGVRAVKKGVTKIKHDEIDRLLDQALLDPEVAKTLVMEWNDSNRKVIERRLKLHLGHELATGAEEGAEPEDKPKEK